MSIKFRWIGFVTVGILFALMVQESNKALGATNIFNFAYAARQELQADGWDFMARTASGTARNTELTNGGNVISYNQGAHPGAIRIPLDSGDLWTYLNNSRNSLFRTLPTNWTRVELDLIFAPVAQFQQVNMALYQDDDNYFQVARTHHPAVSLNREINGSFTGFTQYSVSATNISLCLDRDVVYGDISSYYSLDGTNWIFTGKTGQELIAPRLCIWAGGLYGGSVNAELRQLRIVTSDAPVTSTLYLQPLALVFNSVAGQANTNVQRVNIYHNGPDGFTWSATANASWLSISSTNGGVPGFCDVSVNTSGLTNGVHQAVLSFTASGSVTNTTTLPVTLIVNSNNRATTATWKGGKKGAMSVWIDDSVPVMFTELTANGFAGTYALMGPGVLSQVFATYHNAGMELGSHSESHPCTPQTGFDRRTQLELNISNIVVSTPQTQNRLTSFAWPCGANTLREKVWASDYFLISRGYNWNQLEDTTPKDFMDVKSYNSHEHPPFPPADFKTIVDAAISQGKWANLVFHGFNNDDGAVAYAVGKDIWVGTGGDVTRYILQRDRTILSNYVQTSSHISFDCQRLAIPASPLRNFETAFNTYDTVTFQVSITNLPPVAGVQVNGYPKPYTIRSSGGTTNLFFDALVSTATEKVLITLSNGPVLMVTPDNKTKGYLQNNPSLTGTVSGVIGGDDITATYTTTANSSSPSGTYPITPVFSDPSNRLGNYIVITNLGVLTVTKSIAPITLANLSHTYDGAAHAATATTTPSDLTVLFRYNGIAASPVNAGSYQVIGTISNANFTGTATNTFVIAKSNAPITLGNLNQVYNGAARSATAATVPPGLTVNFTYNGAASPTNAGSYQVIATISEINYHGAATNTLTIAPSNAPVILENLSHVYDGAPRSATAMTLPSGLAVNLTYDASTNAPIAAGNYEVIGTIIDVNHQGADTNTFTISKSNAPVTLENLIHLYDGTARNATATTVPSGLTVNLTYDGNAASPTKAGNYQVIGTINDLNHSGAATNSLVITATPLSVVANNTNRMFGRINPTFAGIVNGVILSDNITASYDSPAIITSPAGDYDIIPTLTDPDSRLSNYIVSATNGLLTIVGAPSFTNITRSPDGLVQLDCTVHAGRVYKFQFKNALADADWTTFVSNHLATSSISVITNEPGSTNLQRFYRAVDVSYP